MRDLSAHRWGCWLPIILGLLAARLVYALPPRYTLTYSADRRQDLLRELDKLGFQAVLDIPNPTPTLVVVIRGPGASSVLAKAPAILHKLALEKLPGVEECSEDGEVKLAASFCKDGGCRVSESENPFTKNEVLPYGVKMVQANSQVLAGVKTTSNTLATVCLVDNGVDITNPDIRGNIIFGPDCKKQRCPSDWKTPLTSHGTQMAGIIAATENSVGVVGVIPNGADLYLSNPFDPETLVSAYVSDIINSMLQCSQFLDYRRAAFSKQWKMVINLSFSVQTESPPASWRAVVSNLYNRGDLLLVAAVGNDGDTDTNTYPASFPEVISVAAVDCNYTVAKSSNRNSKVELSAPGTATRSTQPGLPDVSCKLLRTTIPLTDYPCIVVVGTSENSMIPLGSVTAPVVDCGNGLRTCRSARKICVMRRVLGVDYCKQLQNCKAGGGLGAIIYNTESPTCLPPPEPTHSCGIASIIPGVAVSLAAGQEILSQISRPVTFRIELATFKNFWSVQDGGTSGAAAHVSGVIARLWRAFPRCRNSDIRIALQRSAMDLGPKGRDKAYGFGLVQAADAYVYLSKQPCGRI